MYVCALTKVGKGNCASRKTRGTGREVVRGERRVCPGDGVHQRSEGEGEGGVRNGGRTCVVH